MADDMFDEEFEFLCERYNRKVREALRDGPCEDDSERTMPYVGMLPEETWDEEPSPLRF